VLELAEFFHEAGTAKPDPAPYRAALERLGVAPVEALGFEDSTSGIASTQDPERLRQAGAFVVAKDFTDPELRRFLNH
jgi:beta-phosphoglucomutase-like phosphatase (HAD superfamily)